MGAEIFHTLKSVLKKKAMPRASGDEGGFAPNLKSNEEAIETIIEAIEKPAMKRAEMFCSRSIRRRASSMTAQSYVFKKSDGRKLSSDEMIAFWSDWVR